MFWDGQKQNCCRKGGVDGWSWFLAPRHFFACTCTTQCWEDIPISTELVIPSWETLSYVWTLHCERFATSIVATCCKLSLTTIALLTWPSSIELTRCSTDSLAMQFITPRAVVKVVMCSRGGWASEVETHKNIDSVWHTKTTFQAHSTSISIQK